MIRNTGRSSSKWRTKWIALKAKSYSSVEEHADRAQPRLACSPQKEHGSSLAMCSSRRAASSHPNLATPQRSYGRMLMQERDWETAVNAAEKLGGLHGLVNNAGIYEPRTLMETDTELFERHTRVNQLGCFLGMKTVVPLM